MRENNIASKYSNKKLTSNCAVAESHPTLIFCYEFIGAMLAAYKLFVLFHFLLIYIAQYRFFVALNGLNRIRLLMLVQCLS